MAHVHEQKSGNGRRQKRRAQRVLPLKTVHHVHRALHAQPFPQGGGIGIHFHQQHFEALRRQFGGCQQGKGGAVLVLQTGHQDGTAGMLRAITQLQNQLPHVFPGQLVHAVVQREGLAPPTLPHPAAQAVVVFRYACQTGQLGGRFQWIPLNPFPGSRDQQRQQRKQRKRTQKRCRDLDGAVRRKRHFRYLGPRHQVDLRRAHPAGQFFQQSVRHGVGKARRHSRVFSYGFHLQHMAAVRLTDVQPRFAVASRALQHLLLKFRGIDQQVAVPAQHPGQLRSVRIGALSGGQRVHRTCRTIALRLPTDSIDGHGQRYRRAEEGDHRQSPQPFPTKPFHAQSPLFPFQKYQTRRL